MLTTIVRYQPITGCYLGIIVLPRLSVLLPELQTAIGATYSTAELFPGDFFLM